MGPVLTLLLSLLLSGVDLGFFGLHGDLVFGPFLLFAQDWGT